MNTLHSIEDLQAIINGMPNPVFVKNRGHQIILANECAYDFFGHPRAALLAHADTDLFPPEQTAVFDNADDRVFATGEDDESEEQVTDAKGAVHDVITRKRLVHLGNSDFIVAVVTDVTASREAEAQNRYLAYHDVLTGLPNRALFNERIAEILLGARHFGEHCVLLFIDLDRFKLVNDVYGHPVGDKVLRHVATQINECINDGSVAARIGGDEFAVLQRVANAGVQTSSLASRLIAHIGQPVTLDGQNIRLSASIGIALISGAAADADCAMRHADLALYKAKTEGRGHYRFFEPEMDTMARNRAQTEGELRLAIGRGELTNYYQPLFNILTRRIDGFEALARWNHPARGLVMPDEFIPIAEDSGLIVELGEWVLERACADAAAWDRPLGLSVNISPFQFTQGDLARTVKRVLESTGLAASRLQLEITEGVLIQDADRALTLLNRIRALGVQIVLDDFGSGYSSLSYFKRFPFDKIKIDRSFISDMLNSDHARSIVEAVIALGRGLNLGIVAEGVETEDQLAMLSKLGCRQAQGYLFSSPMPVEHFAGTVMQQGPQARRQAG